MSDFDLDRLGGVWRQQPDPAELEALRRSADRGPPPGPLEPVDRGRGGAGRGGSCHLPRLVQPGKRHPDCRQCGNRGVALQPIRQRTAARGGTARPHRQRRGYAGSVDRPCPGGAEAGEIRRHGYAARLRARVFLSAILPIAVQPAALFHGIKASPASPRRGSRLLAHRSPLAILFAFRSMRKGRQELERLTNLREAYSREGEQVSRSEVDGHPAI